MKRNLITIAVCIVIVVAIVFAAKNSKKTPVSQILVQQSPTSKSSPVPVQSPAVTGETPAPVIVASKMKIPWDLAFLPGGNLLVTERAGNLVEIMADGTKNVIKLPRAVPKGEGGLLGIVLHPNFNTNHELYLYMTTSESAGVTRNAVFRYTFLNNQLGDEKTIIKDIPGALYHDGGRLAFGPDGMLYVTTGDAEQSSIAQDLKSLGGKILRVKDDGSLPSDNPFGTAVYSYGHRNPQGLAWDSEGRLWETEHGRSGVQSGMDELNLIEKGKNYGWPTIEGDKTAANMVTPALNSGPDVTWAPASALYYKGSIFFGALKGEALYEAVLEGGKVKELKRHLYKEYGRIRTTRLGPDGMLYLTTSNLDGRGSPTASDDRIIKLNPGLLK